MRKNKWGRKAVAFFITLSMALGCLNGIVFAAEPVIDTIPGTTREIKEELDASFLSVTGFAKGKVNSRVEYIGQKEYVQVSTGDELVAALDEARKGNVKVIEVLNDIDLGYYSLSDKSKASSSISDYIGNMTYEITNPAIIESGISQLTVSNVDGLTIFSEGGAKISRAEWKLQGTSKDIIIRNIKFDGTWQWSDDGDTKGAGWSIMKVNGAKGVWFDHCSFTMGYDGLCDSENGASGLTYTWCTFGEEASETPDKDSTLYQTMRYAEYRYDTLKTMSSSDEYYKARIAGVPFEKVLAFAAFHHKAFLIGSGDKDYKDNERLGLEDGNQRLEVTFAYSKMSNLGSRVLRMRQGKGHLFNCYIDNQTHYELKKTYPALTEHHLYRCMDIHNGASAAADTCVYNYVGAALYAAETRAEGGDWGTYFKNVHNFGLVVNSKITTTGGTTYEGSSWDNGGSNAFVASGYYTDKYTLNNFCWDVSIKGVESMSRENPPKDEDGKAYPFEFNENVGSLPYEYSVIALDKVEDTVTALSGAFKYRQPAEFWLRTEYAADEDIQPVSDEVPVASLISNFDTAVISKGDIRQIIVTRIPSYATDRSLKFESSNPEVAEVLDSGLIIAKDYGNAIITVSAADGVTKEIAVEVYQSVDSVSLNSRSKTIEAGSTFQLIATITPENATNKTLVWSSSNTSVATVSEDGLVTALTPGKTQITCISQDNTSARATCTITVKEGSGVPENPSSDGFTFDIQEDNTATINVYDGDEVDITIPSEIDGHKVTGIGASAFEGSSLETVVIPDSVTSIGNRAFADSAQLKMITIPASVTEIDEEAFEGCTQLVIVCEYNSAAHYYAMAHGIDFKLEVESEYGDVDSENGVTAEDALIVLKYAAKLADLTDTQLQIADVDGNGDVDAADALLILKKAAKLIEKFPVEEAVD